MGIAETDGPEQDPIFEGIWGATQMLHKGYFTEYEIGDSLLDTLSDSADYISNGGDDLGPYCALLTVMVAARFGRVLKSAVPDEDELEAFGDGPYGLVIDFSEVVELLLEPINDYEREDDPSEKQTTVAVISYLTLGESELARGDPQGHAIGYFLKAFPLCNARHRFSHHPDIDTIQSCISMCQAGEVIGYAMGLENPIWDLTGNDYFAFCSESTRALGITNPSLPFAELSRFALETAPILAKNYTAATGYRDNPQGEQISDRARLFRKDLIDLLENATAFITSGLSKSNLEPEHPSYCEPSGSEYWCWRFGQIIGTISADSPSIDWISLLENIGSSQERNPPIPASLLFTATLSEGYRDNRNWELSGTQALKVWASLSRGRDVSHLEDISPMTGSYWAMRIGFCDGHLDQQTLDESQHKQSLSVQSISLDRDGPVSYAQILDLFEGYEKGFESRMNKLESMLQDRLPSGPVELKQFVDRHLGILRRLNPPGIRRDLVKAEGFYRHPIDVSNSILSFAKAVEGTFQFIFVNGFIKFLKQAGQARVLVKIQFRGTRDLNMKGVLKLGMGEWADALRELDSDDSKSQLKLYVRSEFQGLTPVQISSIADNLEKAQKYRNSSAHFSAYEDPEYAKNLEEFREFCLGINRKSVIEEFLDLYSSRNSASTSKDTVI